MISLYFTFADFDMSFEHEPVDYFNAHCSHFMAADVIVQFWSAKFVTGFYGYAEICTAFFWQPKTVVIIFLEPIEIILAALETMPQHDRIIEKIFSMRECFQHDRCVNSGRLFGISAVGKTFETVNNCLMQLLQSPEVRSTRVTDYIAPAPNNQSEGFDVFISYCWKNSSSAAEAGDVSEYIGLTDPRFLKAEIERETGLKCWLDVEQLGSDGLFHGLYKALNSPSLSVVILCLSDEYGSSVNCYMELQYVVRRLPCLVVCVGDGEGWRTKPIGLLSSFQESFNLCQNPYPITEEGKVAFSKLIIRIQSMCKLKSAIPCSMTIK
jgi:hypothetical protein